MEANQREGGGDHTVSNAGVAELGADLASEDLGAVLDQLGTALPELQLGLVEALLERCVRVWMCVDVCGCVRAPVRYDLPRASIHVFWYCERVCAGLGYLCISLCGRLGVCVCVYVCVHARCKICVHATCAPPPCTLISYMKQ